MLESVLDSNAIVSEVVSSGASLQAIIICFVVSILLGVVIAFIYQKTSEKYSHNFIVTLAVLPILVQGVIFLVNGNLGTGVAILGAFSLVRFRTIPGSSKEIAAIFFAMTVGLSMGMGYVFYAVMLTGIVGILFIVLKRLHFGVIQDKSCIVCITVPENLDYETVFTDLLEKYCEQYELEKTKTTNLGSMFELSYRVIRKNEYSQKAFIDELRCRNGNLRISMGRMDKGELTL